MQRKNLLFTPDYPPSVGGVARYLHEMVQFFAPRASGTTHLLVQTKRLSTRFLWPHWLPSLLIMIARARQYDQLLISHVLPFGLAARMAHVFTRRPYIVFLHGMDFALALRNPWKRRLTRSVLRRARLIVTNTEFLEREVRGFCGNVPTLVVHPCLADEFLAASRVPKEASPTTDSRATHFLTVARLVPRKGHLTVLDAIAYLRDHNRMPPMHYHIVGDGPLYERILEHVRELRLLNVVSFNRAATDADLVELYRSSDVFIMPTEHLGKDIEGFGTVYLEAGAFGLPIIASELTGVDEAVIDGQTGLLVPSGSVADLADAIEILAKNPERRRELGNDGRKRAHEDFTCEKQFGKLDAYL